MQIKFHKLSPEVPTPVYQTDGAVAFDLAANVDVVIPAGEVAIVPTGLVIETPKGFALVLASRSSLPRKKGLNLANGIGVVDQDYCGPKDEIGILVRNFTEQPVEIKKGERLAQGMFVRVEKAEFVETEKPHAEQSRGGFGSTSGYHA